MKVSFKYITCFIFVCLLLTLSTSAMGTEISIPPQKSAPGEQIVIPIMIDKTVNLAGVKIVMEYDAALLSFEKAVKTKETSSLMHIVNSKKPGKLIAVMAGARGVKGKKFPILLFTFRVNKKLSASVETKIKIVQTQLMGDDLKDINHSVKSGSIKIEKFKDELKVKKKASPAKPIPSPQALDSAPPSP